MAKMTFEEVLKENKRFAIEMFERKYGPKFCREDAEPEVLPSLEEIRKHRQMIEEMPDGI